MELYDIVFYSSLSLPFLILLVIKLLFPPKLIKLHKTNIPPSPPSIPILGHLHILRSPQPMHHTLHNLSKKYGPIISLKFGSRPVIVVSSSSLAEECFTKNDIVFANRPFLLINKHINYNWTTMTTAPYGEHWRNLRRLGAIEVFSSHRLNAFLSIRKEEIRRLLRILGSRCDGSGGGGYGKVEMKSLFSELSFNIMMRMVAGKRYHGSEVEDEEEALEFRKILKEILEIGGVSYPGDFLPIMNWINNGAFEKKVMKLGQKMDLFFQKLIDEHRKKKEGFESMNTMIDHLLSLQETQPEYYTDQIIKGLILVMIVAGTDTTSVTMEWAMSNLVNNPNTLDKARTEVDTKIDEDVLIEEQDILKLPYLQSIISETLRLNPAAALLLPHVSSQECKVGGYHVPRDTLLLVNAWAIHRDPNIWKDPLSFKPERFENVKTSNIIPFGLGRRSCPGSGLAQRVVGLTLGSLIQCFEWKRVEGKKVDMSDGKGVTTPKVVPLEVLCKPRPIMNKLYNEKMS